MKTKRYKDGNKDVHREFNDATWKNMTEREKAMWTEFSEDDLAPIPKEVIEFKEKQPVETIKAEIVTEPPADEQDEKAIIKEELRRLGIRYAPNSKLETLKAKLESAKYAND